MPALLVIENLSIDFLSGKQIFHAVKNVSFSVNKNETLAIVGESGSGKSVTALSILQLIPSPPVKYPKGNIFFTPDQSPSIDLLHTSREELLSIRGNKIAMIFQEPMSSLNPVMTCGKQITEAIQLHQQLSYKEAKQKTISWFERVKLPFPGDMFERYPHQLSGGQKQRVMIAMAMCCEPDLLICDEPTTALDVTVQKTILELIKELQKETGMGVIFITHDLGVVADIADRTVVMYKGEVVEENAVREIFRNPQKPYTKALLACRPVNHQKGKRLPVVSDFLRNDVDTEKSNIESVTNEHPDITSTDKTPIISVKNLTVQFPAKKNVLGKPVSYFTAVDNVSFEVYKGETLGLVGESGCGKTTLGRSLLRLVEPASGQIFYKDVDLTKLHGKSLQKLRKEMQIIFQDPFASLNPRIMIGDAIGEPLAVHHILKNEKDRKEKVKDLLEQVNLDANHINRYPHEFSGGQRQRLVIARSLSLNPGFIVCDESVSALDVSVQAQVLNLINDLKREYGFTVIFISHDLSVVKYISDRIMVMREGKIIESGLAEDVFYQPKEEYTRDLIKAIPGGITGLETAI